MNFKFFAPALLLSVAMLSACSPSNKSKAKDAQREVAQAAFLEKFEQNSSQFINEAFVEENCILTFERKRENIYSASNFQVNLSKIKALKIVSVSARVPYWQLQIDDIQVEANMYSEGSSLLSNSGQRVVLNYLYKDLAEKMKKCNVTT